MDFGFATLSNISNITGACVGQRHSFDILTLSSWVDFFIIIIIIADKSSCASSADEKRLKSDIFIILYTYVSIILLIHVKKKMLRNQPSGTMDCKGASYSYICIRRQVRDTG